MKHYIIIFLSIILHLSINTDFALSQYKIRTVVIDPGHGGKDPGAIGTKAKEKDITLSISLKLGEYIKKYLTDVNVYYTRKKDVFIELFKRAEIANKKHADVFISIHVNSFYSSKPYGTATYVMGLKKSKDNIAVAKRENAVILKEKGYLANYKGFDPNSPDSYIVFSLLQNANLSQSLNLAQKVESQFKNRAGRKSRGVKQAALVVLWNATMPAILVETGFISNAKEQKYLMSSQGQSYIASAIFRAFRDYKNEIEKNKKNIKQIKYPTNTNTKTTTTKTDNKKYKNKNSVIKFKVQIKSSVKKIKSGSKELYEYNNAEEMIFGKIYKYYIGNTNDFQEILKIQTRVRKKVKDAFVVAFKNGKRITVKQALNDLKK